MKCRKFVIPVTLSLFFMSCKKNIEEVMVIPPPVVTPAPVNDNLLKDSSLLLAKDIYLWNTQVPSSFDARIYADPNKIMEGIRQYSSEPGFTQPVDRFSFAMKKTEWDNTSEGMSLLGTTASDDGDFGLTVFFKSEADLRVRLVEPNSPAGLAGIRRGWRVTKINQNSNINTGSSSLIVDNVYNAANVSLTFQKPDGSSVVVALTQAHYATRPVYLDTVYTVTGKKIGYLVFNSFLGKQDQLSKDFQRVFSKFASAGVQDVIIDLRYNGGGYVSVQEKLANYLVNPAASGGVMMKQVFNANNSRSNETTKFRKEGSLNLSRIYFIVGRGTASASELLINNLKPYMDVRLFGGTTSGKPVGFFPIPVGEWYIFPVSFRTVNKNGEGNYFNGLQVNNPVADGLDKDWGDLAETSLAFAVRNISGGLNRSQTSSTPFIEEAAVAKGNEILEEPIIKLTIGSSRKN